MRLRPLFLCAPHALLPSLPGRAIANGLAWVAWPPRDVREQRTRFTLLNAPGTSCQLIRARPWQQGPHRIPLAVDGRIRFQQRE